MSSRLFQEVREKRGLVYSVYSSNRLSRGRFVRVSAGTSPKNVQECVDVVSDEIGIAVRSGVTEAEMELAKEHIKGSLTLSLESRLRAG